MKRLTAILDLSAFIFSGAISLALLLGVLFVTLFFKKRRHGAGPVNAFSFSVCDLISNKYPSMLEDALLDGYIANHHYIYLDFNHRHDRFGRIDEGIFFHSIAAHPDSALYNAGFRKMNMLFVEMKMLHRAFLIASGGRLSFVKAHDPHMLGLNGLVISRLFRLPSVLHMNCDFDMKYRGTGKVSSPLFVSRPAERLFEKAILRSYDLIMADRKFYASSRNFPKGCLAKYRPFGVRVDARHYAEPSKRRDLKEALGLGGRKVLLYVGRLHPVKYPADVIKTFTVIKKGIQDAALLMVGEGALKRQLEDLAGERGVAESVFFLGPKSCEDLVDIFHTADVLLAPHGGVTLVESALASTPVVAYDFDWHSEFLEDGRMGYLAPFGDFEGLAEKTISILKDDSLRQAMGKYSRQCALVKCRRDESLAAEKKAYERLIGR